MIQRWAWKLDNELSCDGGSEAGSAGHAEEAATSLGSCGRGGHGQFGWSRRMNACTGLADDVACGNGSLLGSVGLFCALGPRCHLCIFENLFACRQFSLDKSPLLILVTRAFPTSSWRSKSRPDLHLACWSTNESHSPVSKLRKRSSNRFLGSNPPRGGR